MFDNCRQFNEEGSLIYEDANTLERVLLDRSNELGPILNKPNKMLVTICFFTIFIYIKLDLFLLYSDKIIN